VYRFHVFGRGLRRCVLPGFDFHVAREDRVEELLQEERIRYVVGDDPPHLSHIGRIERKKESE
jgi:hypothetical protein